MKRMKFLFGQRRMQVLLTLAALLLAVSVIVASSASFTSTSANPANTFTAGNLHHLNSKPGGAILGAGPMMPTDTTNGFVKITNDGNIAADFTLTMQAPVDKLGTAVVPALSLSAGEGIAKLSDTLDLVVNDGTTDIYTGKLKNFAPLSVGNFAAGASKTFEFTVTFPDTDVGGVKGADNKYKGSETTVEFDWEAIGS